jgi:hypothetical protein
MQNKSVLEAQSKPNIPEGGTQQTKASVFFVSSDTDGQVASTARGTLCWLGLIT